MTSLVGNDAARGAIAAAAEGDNLHHAWLIAGPEGVGKATHAREVSAWLLAREAGENGGRTDAMIVAGAHPDFRVLDRLPVDADKPEKGTARSIKIDQVRALGPMFAVKPSMSSRRMIVIDAIDDLERPASNALLKNLEEPPTGTVFLLISHAPGRLLPTIRSRCRLLRFDPLGDADVASVLRGALPQANADEIAALVRAGAGSPGRALRFAGLDLAAIETALMAIAGDGDPSNQQRVRLSKALAPKAAQSRYEAFLERVPAFIAERARAMSGDGLRDALDAYASAADLARMSIAQSLDAGTTAFEMGGLVARLARPR